MIGSCQQKLNILNFTKIKKMHEAWDCTVSEIYIWVSWSYRFSKTLSNSFHAKIRGCVILSCLNLRPLDGSVVSNVSVFVRQEDSWRSQEMPESLRHRAQRPVVHGLPLEESLPTLPGLNRGRARGRGGETRTEEGCKLRPHLVDVLYFLKPEILCFYTLSTFC